MPVALARQKGDSLPYVGPAGPPHTHGMLAPFAIHCDIQHEHLSAWQGGVAI